MVNIDTYKPNTPGLVTKTRKVTRTHDAAMPRNLPAGQTAPAGERRGRKPDRRKAQRRVLLDLRCGRDRRRAGVDVKA
ncbi:MAG: hypothetical protein GYB33_18615 [Gammaproteobacteria bacterium]|uniref:hypothetical protein n=1 Tax=Pseudomaricurvus alcaniphilus TaxID=1166482 RepID=UPI00140B4ECC|nr:hypothetical protein [Pseudomaricurvus alcaniphilus]MBR9912358.1 hypothetical protein [Gammaproteobacteria bacterium]NHN35821.1 hypothetical protein [Pseudomaricurvus alcaniphilus]